MRLPDVLGEFDQFESSQRVWCTVNWLINSEKYPVVLTKAMKEKKLSFVDSLDVAKMVHHFIESNVAAIISRFLFIMRITSPAIKLLLYSNFMSLL